jgi:hypothetical protein
MDLKKHEELHIQFLLTARNKAWIEGIKAREEGKPVAANPYVVTCGGEVAEHHTELASAWVAGFGLADAVLDLPKGG